MEEKESIGYLIARIFHESYTIELRKHAPEIASRIVDALSVRRAQVPVRTDNEYRSPKPSIQRPAPKTERPIMGDISSIVDYIQKEQGFLLK